MNFEATIKKIDQFFEMYNSDSQILKVQRLSLIGDKIKEILKTVKKAEAPEVFAFKYTLQEFVDFTKGVPTEKQRLKKYAELLGRWDLVREELTNYGSEDKRKIPKSTFDETLIRLKKLYSATKPDKNKPVNVLEVALIASVTKISKRGLDNYPYDTTRRQSAIIFDEQKIIALSLSKVDKPKEYWSTLLKHISNKHSHEFTEVGKPYSDGKFEYHWIMPTHMLTRLEMRLVGWEILK